MKGEIEIGDTFKSPKFRDKNGPLRTFDRVVANPMWNQDWFTGADYDGIERISDTLKNWKEEDKLSRIVDHVDLIKNDYNISPSRYIHTSDAEIYRPIAEIVKELEAREVDRALEEILARIIK